MLFLVNYLPSAYATLARLLLQPGPELACANLREVKVSVANTVHYLEQWDIVQENVPLKRL